MVASLVPWPSLGLPPFYVALFACNIKSWEIERGPGDKAIIMVDTPMGYKNSYHAHSRSMAFIALGLLCNKCHMSLAPMIYITITMSYELVQV